MFKILNFGPKWASGIYNYLSSNQILHIHQPSVERLPWLYQTNENKILVGYFYWKLNKNGIQCKRVI